MECSEAIRKLKNHESELRALGVQALAVFGSTARGEAHMDSDVDLLVELDKTRRITLFDLSEIKFRTTDILGKPADISIRENLRPTYRPGIEADAIPVF